jgi:hypothetical protein
MGHGTATTDSYTYNYTTCNTLKKYEEKMIVKRSAA